MIVLVRVLLLVRVEVIVDVDAIDVVPLDHVEDDRERVVLHVAGASGSSSGACRRAWRGPGRRLVMWSSVAGDLARRRAGAVRVEPGVQFQPAGVGLGHGEGERVVARATSPSSPVRNSLHGSSFDSYRASAIGRTWKTTALSFSSTHLSRMAMSSAFCLSAGRPGLRRPVDVGDGGDPDAAELALQRRRVVGGDADGADGGEQSRGTRRARGEPVAEHGRTFFQDGDDGEADWIAAPRRQPHGAFGRLGDDGRPGRRGRPRSARAARKRSRYAAEETSSPPASATGNAAPKSERAGGGGRGRGEFGGGGANDLAGDRRRRPSAASSTTGASAASAARSPPRYTRRSVPRAASGRTRPGSGR